LIYELIHSNSHNNGIALYRCEGLENSYFKKVALSNDGNKSIINESKGYDYFSNISGNNIKVNLNTETRYEINIPEFSGTRFSHNYSFPMNINVIENVINFYKKFWQRKSKIPIHGHLGLNNILLGKNKNIYIIDWEHFHLADEDYYGFDIIHLLFLNIYTRIDKLKYREVEFLVKCYKSLFNDVPDKNKIKNKPFTNSQSYMVNNSENFSIKIPIEEKFVLAGYPKEMLAKLDQIII